MASRNFTASSTTARAHSGSADAFSRKPDPASLSNTAVRLASTSRSSKECRKSGPQRPRRLSMVLARSRAGWPPLMSCYGKASISAYLRFEFDGGWFRLCAAASGYTASLISIRVGRRSFSPRKRYHANNGSPAPEPSRTQASAANRA
jgi:hypothetical protein